MDALTLDRPPAGAETLTAAVLMAAQSGLVIWMVVPREAGTVGQARAVADASGVNVDAKVLPRSIQLRFTGRTAIIPFAVSLSTS